MRGGMAEGMGHIKDKSEIATHLLQSHSPKNLRCQNLENINNYQKRKAKVDGIASMRRPIK